MGTSVHGGHLRWSAGALMVFDSRWVLLVLFPVGYLMTAGRLTGSSSEYLALTVASFLGCGVLLSQLGRRLQLTLPFWALLLLFLTHYGQLYWIGVDPAALHGWWLPDLEWMSEAPEVLLGAFATTTLGFTSFCLTASLLLASLDRNCRDAADADGGINHQKVFRTTLLILLVIVPATSYAMYAGHIAVMGSEATSLPFHLAGLVYYGRLATIPGLILVMLWCADQLRSRPYLIATFAGACIYGVTDMMLRASRGSLAALFLPIGLLFVLTGRMTRRRVWSFIAIGSGIVALWPVMTLYRLSRAAEDPSLAVSLRQGLDAFNSSDLTISGVVLDALRAVVLRITGAVSLMPAVGASLRPLGPLSATSVTSFFTTEVMGYPAEAVHSSAPSLLGWFYLVGGNLLVIAGVFGLTVAVWMMWRQLRILRLRCLHVDQALVATCILSVSVDGVLDRLYLPTLSCVMSVIVCELVTRLGERRHHRAADSAALQ